jgi:hypothetical protein
MAISEVRSRSVPRTTRKGTLYQPAGVGIARQQGHLNHPTRQIEESSLGMGIRALYNTLICFGPVQGDVRTAQYTQRRVCRKKD